jgi:hypothetical protein
MFSDYLKVGSNIPLIHNFYLNASISFLLDNNRRQAAGDAYRE